MPRTGTYPPLGPVQRSIGDLRYEVPLSVNDIGREPCTIYESFVKNSHTHLLIEVDFPTHDGCHDFVFEVHEASVVSSLPSWVLLPRRGRSHVSPERPEDPPESRFHYDFLKLNVTSRSYQNCV